jgi:hypothetical protein
MPPILRPSIVCCGASRSREPCLQDRQGCRPLCARRIGSPASITKRVTRSMAFTKFSVCLIQAERRLPLDDCGHLFTFIRRAGTLEARQILTGFSAAFKPAGYQEPATSASVADRGFEAFSEHSRLKTLFQAKQAALASDDVHLHGMFVNAVITVAEDIPLRMRGLRVPVRIGGTRHERMLALLDGFPDVLPLPP